MRERPVPSIHALAVIDHNILRQTVDHDHQHKVGLDGAHSIHQTRSGSDASFCTLHLEEDGTHNKTNQDTFSYAPPDHNAIAALVCPPSRCQHSNLAPETRPRALGYNIDSERHKRGIGSNVL